MVVRSSGSQPVSTSEARAALRAAGVRCDEVVPIGDGNWSSDVFEVDGRLIARFPRNGEVAAGHDRERRLLPALAAFVSFRVPVPLSDSVFVYEKVPGRPFQRGDDLDAAFAMIDELHAFPVEEARRLLGTTSLADEYAEEWAMFEDQVLPHLPSDLLERVSFQRLPPTLERETLIHDDLGPEHVLVGDDGRPVGILDFEDATVGDPVCDLVPLTVVAGRPLTGRMHRYRVRGTMHAVAYFHREGRDQEIEAAVAELRRRLDLRPGR